MAGYSTLSRKIPGQPLTEIGAWLPGQDPIVANSSFSDDDTQTTYSFRTGRRDPGDTVNSLLDTSMREFGKTPYDNGHEFWTIRSHHTPNPILNLKRGTAFFQGPMVLNGIAGYTQFGQPILMSKFMEDNPAYSDANLNSLGASYIKQTNPLKPNAGLSQFVGELRERLPSIVSAAVTGGIKNIPKGVGNDYLNVQFGWLPMINDFRKFAEAIAKAPRILENILNGSGKDHYRKRSRQPVRETFTYSSKKYLQEVTGNGIAWYSGAFNFFNGQTPSCDMSSYSSVEHRTWFTGMFTYLLEEGEDLLSQAKRYEAQANAFLGTRFDASTFWELTPWSWMIDWMFDIGDVLSNYESFSKDNLLLKYGYLMSQTRWDINTTLDIGSPYGGPMNVSRHEWVIHKRRVRSTPYGFGLNPGSFSDQQWAILGALGLSKGPKQLW